MNKITLKARVTVTDACPHCVKGMVPNPVWTEFNRDVESGSASLEKMEDWFIERGKAIFNMHMGQAYCNLPPEEIPCPECKGTAELDTLVTLEEIRELLAQRGPQDPAKQF